MTLQEIQDNIIEIAKFSLTAEKVASDNDALFDFLKNLPFDVKEAMFKRYENQKGPVNSIRRSVAQNLLNNSLDGNAIKAQFDNEKSEKPKLFNTYRNLFSLLYPFVDYQIHDKLYKTFDELVNRIKSDLNIVSKVKDVAYGFDGARHTGSARVWFAIFNKQHPNQKTAKQMFFDIQHGIIRYALYDRPNDVMLKEIIDQDSSVFNYNTLLEFFRGIINDIELDYFISTSEDKHDIQKIIDEIIERKRNAWIVKPGEKAKLLNDMIKDSSFKIGWGYVVKDIVAENNYTDTYVLDRLNIHYNNGKTQTNNKVTILSFLKEMKAGDVLFAASGVSEVIAVGVITNDIQIDNDDDEFAAYREVDWLKDFSDNPYHPSFTLPIKTITSLEKKHAIQWLKEIFDIADKKEYIKSGRRFSLNSILYGPPGTGKTYNTIDMAVEIITAEKRDHESNKILYDSLRKQGKIEFVTFHQNYTYDDFMVGLAPDITSGQLRFDRKEGVFKKIADKARKNWLNCTKQEKSEVQFLTVFNSFFNDLIQEDVKEVPIPMKRDDYSFKITFIDEANGRIKFTKQSGGTRHDLLIKNVQGIFDGTLNYPNDGLGIYYYPLVEKLREHALSFSGVDSFESTEKLERYVLIIDEINRANVSRVFGELITLLEDDKRLGAANELAVTLPNGEEFVVPPNLYILGTMNTADKSISLIDIALRRRFEFIGVYPDYEVLNLIQPERTRFLQELNNNIYKKRKSADYLIGHAYLLSDDKIVNIIMNKIIPLLMEYFSGRKEEVADVFDQTGYTAKYDELTHQWIISLNDSIHVAA